MTEKNILIIDKFYTDLLRSYRLKYHIDHKPDITVPELMEIIGGYRILIISTRIAITPEIIEKADNLKLIIRMGAGVDHINLPACKEKNIIVCNTPHSNVQAVCEYVFGQILLHYRNFVTMHTSVLEGHFRDGITWGKQLNTKTIGIIGTGRIGSNIARIAKVFGMRVVGCDPYLTDQERMAIPADKWMPYKELVEQSDIVTLHVPLTTETEYMVNDEFLGLMKQGSLLINSSRGKVVKLDDVYKHAYNGVISKIIIDVFEKEPYQPAPVCVEDCISHLYFSPHAAAYTEESLFARSKEALEQVDEYTQERTPHGFIDYDKGY